MAVRSTSWKVRTLLLTLYALLYVVFVGEGWLQRSMATEQQYNEAFYTRDLARHAEQRASTWFTDAFVTPGIVQGTFDLTLPKESDHRRSIGARGFGSAFFAWWEGRLRTWWTVVYQSFKRASGTLLWWPYALFMFVPWVVDGWVHRRVRQTSFLYSSPLQHRISLYVVEALLLAVIVLFFLPVPLHPLLWPAMLLAGGCAVSVALSRFAKRA